MVEDHDEDAGGIECEAGEEDNGNSSDYETVSSVARVSTAGRP